MPPHARALSPSSPLASLAALSICTAAQGSVITVDIEGGADFTQIAAAAFVASSGDTILVNEGEYLPFVIDGKSLVIVAESGHDVQVNGTVLVQNLAAHQQASVSGISSTGSIFNEALVVRDNLGTVWIERGDFVGQEASFFSTGDAASISNNGRVVVSDSKILGADSVSVDIVGGCALSISDTTLYTYDTTIRGGDGAEGFLPGFPSGDGGDGVVVSGGFLFFSGTSVRGGDGGNFSGIPCENAGSGGDGLVMVSNDPAVFQIDTTFTAGVAGTTSQSECIDGLPGEPMVVLSGETTDIPGPSRSIRVSSPVREGDTVHVQLTGAPGELGFMIVGQFLDPQFFLPLKGVYQLGEPRWVILLGPLDSSGELNFQYPFLPLANAGIQAVNLFEQGCFFNPSEGFTLGNGQVVVHLDSAY